MSIPSTLKTLSSTLSKLPRWSILVVGTSALLFALSLGIVRLERSGSADEAVHDQMSTLAIGKGAGTSGTGSGAPEDPKAGASPLAAGTEFSKWGPREPEEPAWTGGQKWDDETEVGDLSSLDCVIEPHQVVSIRSPVRGMIDSIHFERSDLVEEGDILVQLESGAEHASVDLARLRAEVNASVKSRQAALELSKRRSERAARLYASNALSLDLHEEVDTEAELARFELEHAADENHLAKLEHREALERLRRRTIRSPIAGVVIERLMAPGEVVDDEIILRLAQIDPLGVEIVLPAESFGSIVPGTKAAVIPEIPGDEVQMGSVTIVDRVVDAASGTFGARLELPNPDGAIPSGLHCQVRFLDE
jgi:RND family efflux transporter MFP subunit